MQQLSVLIDNRNFNNALSDINQMSVINAF